MLHQRKYINIKTGYIQACTRVNKVLLLLLLDQPLN